VRAQQRGPPGNRADTRLDEEVVVFGAEPSDEVRLKGLPAADDGVPIEFLLSQEDGQALLSWLARRGVRPVAGAWKRSRYAWPFRGGQPLARAIAS
jgi:hypothetical protein